MRVHMFRRAGAQSDAQRGVRLRGGGEVDFGEPREQVHSEVGRGTGVGAGTSAGKVERRKVPERGEWGRAGGRMRRSGRICARGLWSSSIALRNNALGHSEHTDAGGDADTSVFVEI